MTTAPLVLSRRKKIVFALLAFFLVFLVSVAALLAFDVYLHHRVQYAAGVNVWGYRGDPAGRKKPGQTRVVVLGGSTAFGYGLPWNESWPYYLEQKINARRPGQTPVSVVNLGIPADTARTFVTTLSDYAYLDYDIACFYEGYNDLGQAGPGFKNLTNPGVAHYLEWRYQSPIFRWTGYFPIFPLVLNEKAMAMRYGGNLNAAYGAEKVVFRPNIATRATATALETASALGMKMERTFAPKPLLSGASDGNCGRWAQYCGAIADAVQKTISQGKRAVVITQPYLAEIHIEQQTAMADMLARRFAGDPRVRYVNLGRAIDIHDTSLVYDGLHLVAHGNEMLADALTPTLLDLIK
jgi:hypothetical protein